MRMNEQLNKLFEEWADEHKKEPAEDYGIYHKKERDNNGYIPKENFIYDGPFFEDKYIKAPTKVLFIAKECNSGEPDEPIKPVIYKNDDNYWAKQAIEEAVNGKQPNNTFLRGAAMLYNATLDENYSKPNKKIDTLADAALINLNKRGGYSFCVWDTLAAYVKKYQAKIKKQIRILNPDIIICCGESVRQLVDDYHLVAEGKDIRTAFHPSYYSVSDKEKLLFFKSQGKEEWRDKTDKQTTRECRGYILDTNNKWDKESEIDMMRESKAYAYGDARHFLGWFRKDDYVLFYSADKRKIIAIGKVREKGENDDSDKAWWEVDPIVPKDFSKVTEDKCLDMSAVNKIVYGNDYQKINLRGTVKRKIIEEGKVKEIIDEMEKMYDV